MLAITPIVVSTTSKAVAIRRARRAFTRRTRSNSEQTCTTSSSRAASTSAPTSGGAPGPAGPPSMSIPRSAVPASRTRENGVATLTERPGEDQTAPGARPAVEIKPERPPVAG